MCLETIPELLNLRANLSPDEIAHWTLNKEDKWQPTTWAKYQESVHCLARGFQEAGLLPGERVGIMAAMSQACEYAQMSILISGGTVVAVSSQDLIKNINDIIDKTNMVGLVIQNPGLLKKVSSQLSSKLNFIVSIEDLPKNNQIKNLINITRLQKTKNKKSSVQNKVTGKDPGIITFTSGTTGAPKGIVYTHKQVCIACECIHEVFPDVSLRSNLICWLPFSSLFQRMMNFFAVKVGAPVYFVDNPADLVKQIPHINPYLFIGVPRFFEKIYSGIMAEINKKPLLLQKIINLSLRVGNIHATSLRFGKKSFKTYFLHKIIDSLVLKQLRTFLGTNIKYAISGSAPIPLWLLERFHAMGILILEAYGASENIVPIAMNSLDNMKFGTVGKPLSENKIKFTDDSELLIKGAGVFAGYYIDNPGECVLTSDGYLPTGDLGKVDEQGFITLTGRKSEIFKTSAGRQIAPAGIENAVQKISYIEHAVVFGAGRRLLIMLLSISPLLLFEYAKGFNIVLDDNQTKIPTALYDMIGEDVIQNLAEFPKHQSPAGLLLTSTPFTVEGLELNVNLKLRRQKIEEKFKAEINDLYARLEETQFNDERIITYSL